MDKSAIRRFAGSSNRRERRKAKRLIAKKLKTGGLFRTGTGKLHEVQQKTASHVYIYSSDKGTTVKIPLLNIKLMVAYFNRVRIAERKELEAFHSYNSIMFGLLHQLFDNESKISLIGKVMRLIKIGVRIFLAGGERCPKDLEMASMAGAKYVLFSYYYLRDRQAIRRKSSNFSLLLKGKVLFWNQRKI